MRESPLILSLILVLGGCAEWQGSSHSVGVTNAGYLRGGVALDDRGTGFRRGRPGESTRFGTPELVAALTRAASLVDAAFPGGPPLRIGDVGAPDGGQHPRHHSHRAGRDVDVVFFVSNASGDRVDARAAAFDRHGIGRSGDGELVTFDVARNWEFVRSLLLDDSARVQWIFCSHGVKSLLLRYAARNEPNPDAIVRATDVLHQPSNGRPHDDHFHVRVLCSANDAASGCRDVGPRWPWLRDSLERHARAETMDDAAVLRELSPLGPTDDAR